MNTATALRQSEMMDGVPDNVRDEMVRTAWRLIAERGLQGMSTREVLARTGAPRGSVYHYFPQGRAQLVAEAIELARTWMLQQVDAIDASTPAEVATGYLDIWRRILETMSFEAGCAVTGVVTGAPSPIERDQALAAFDDQRRALAERLRRFGIPASEADERATLLISAAEGAVLLARAQRSIEPLLVVARQLRTIFS